MIPEDVIYLKFFIGYDKQVKHGAFILTWFVIKIKGNDSANKQAGVHDCPGNGWLKGIEGCK